MKTTTQTKIVVLLLFFGMTTFAQSVPPPSPGPPGFGISENLWTLGLVALVFGLYKIKNSINLKRN